MMASTIERRWSPQIFLILSARVSAQSKDAQAAFQPRSST
jgi:hypothetical protein